MVFLLFILILFMIFVGGGWVLGKGLGKILFPTEKETYIDKSVHHHYYTTTHHHEHKNISIIDDNTKKKIFELKETKTT